MSSVANFYDAFEAIAGDLDGDGQLEVVATSWDLRGGWRSSNTSATHTGRGIMQLSKMGGHTPTR